MPDSVQESEASDCGIAAYDSQRASWSFRNGPHYNLIETRQLHLEEILIDKFMKYSGRTGDPGNADFFLLPIRACRRVRCDLVVNKRDNLGKQIRAKETQRLEDESVRHVVHTLPYFNSTARVPYANHLLILGCVERAFYSDYSRSRSSLLERHFEIFKSRFLVYSIESSRIARTLPYPTFFRFEETTNLLEIQDQLRKQHRDIDVYFAGNLPMIIVQCNCWIRVNRTVFAKPLLTS